MELLFGFVLGIIVTITAVTYTLDADQTVKLLNETCSVNKGIEKVRVDISEFRFNCKDGAKFNISR